MYKIEESTGDDPFVKNMFLTKAASHWTIWNVAVHITYNSYISSHPGQCVIVGKFTDDTLYSCTGTQCDLINSQLN